MYRKVADRGMASNPSIGHEPLFKRNSFHFHPAHTDNDLEWNAVGSQGHHRLQHHPSFDVRLKFGKLTPRQCLTLRADFDFRFLRSR